MKMMMNNAAVFIDIAKQYDSITRLNREVRIDYKALLDEIKKDNLIHRAYAYGVQIDNESDLFIKMLRHIGYCTKYKYAKLVKDYSLVNNALVSHDKPNIKETSWTLGITLDIIRNINHINKVIIGSNDPELADVLEWIKEKGCIIEIYARSVPRELRLFADRIYDIPSSALQVNPASASASASAPASAPAPVKGTTDDVTKEPESVELSVDELRNGS